MFRAERYPKDWKAIRARILARAGNACECAGECGDTHDGDNGRCDAPHGEWILRDPSEPWRWTEHDPSLAGKNPEAVRVVLTVAHLNHQESDNRDSNLMALCQRCHLNYDRTDNARRRRESAQRGKAVGTLPGLGG